MEKDVGISVPGYSSAVRRNQSTGTVYHDSTVKKPQNICPVCGKSFLFQLQLRVHLESHDEDEENINNLSVVDNNTLENGLEIKNVRSLKSMDSESHEDIVLHSPSQNSERSDDIQTELHDTMKDNESETESANLNVNVYSATSFQDSLMESVAMIGQNDVQETEIEACALTNTETEISSEENPGDLVTAEMEDNKDEADEDTMDLDYGTVEELNKSSYVENDINLGEVINHIKEGEESHDTSFSSENPEAEVIVINKDIGKINRKPDISKLKHECPICNELFQWPYQLKRHVNIHNGYYPYECEICGRKFDRSSSLRDHGMVHRKDRPFECEVCGVKFTLKNNLAKHMNRHTQKKIWKCEHCKKPFLQRDQLIAHLIVHKGDKPFPCEVCGKAFARKTNLKEHMITHSTEKNYPCDFCNKTFNKPYSKKIHMRHHLDTKPHKCDVCGASFSQSCALVTHIRRHTGERPFACPMCPRSFAQQSTLQTHVATHTGEKNFRCGVCNKAFLRKRSLTEHMRLHTGEKPFKCMLCDFTTATKVGLKRHIETHVKQLIRNADIDLTGLGDLPPLGETNIMNKTDLSELSVNLNEMVNETLNATNHVNETGDSFRGNLTGAHRSDSGDIDATTERENEDFAEITEEKLGGKLIVKEQGESDGNESLVYLNGLNLIVSELNKLCNDKFDPQLLDESFVRHIINQSSLLFKKSNKPWKEPIRFECEVCKMILPHKKSMTEHMKTHQPEPEVKNHTCVICDKKFLHRKSLLIHTRSHTGERPYKCDICESTFTNKRSLQRHHQNMHKGIVVVKSAQEYAQALAEKKEVADVDSPTLEGIESSPKIKKIKKVAKRKTNSKTLAKHVQADLCKNPDSFETVQYDKNSVMTQSDGLETDMLEPTEVILKQAELAAKSICESLFGKSDKTSGFGSKGKSKSKRKRKAGIVDSHLSSNSLVSIQEEQCNSQEKERNNSVVKDGYTALRNALQSGNPVQNFTSATSKKGSVKHRNMGSSLGQVYLDVDNNEQVQTDLSIDNESDVCILDDDKSDASSELHPIESKQEAVPNLSKSVQDEYDALRKTLQKSLNSVSEKHSKEKEIVSSLNSVGTKREKKVTNKRTCNNDIVSEVQTAPVLNSKRIKSEVLIADEETSADNDMSDCESNVSSILRNVFSTEIAATLAPLNL